MFVAYFFRCSLCHSGPRNTPGWAKKRPEEGMGGRSCGLPLTRKMRVRVARVCDPLF